MLNLEESVFQHGVLTWTSPTPYDATGGTGDKLYVMIPMIYYPVTFGFVYAAASSSVSTPATLSLDLRTGAGGDTNIGHVHTAASQTAGTVVSTDLYTQTLVTDPKTYTKVDTANAYYLVIA
jgi:hypothetical protein